MTNAETYEGWVGRNAIDVNGDKVGSITDIYYDDVSGQPEWLTVKTGLLGTNSSFVPMQGADASGDDLRLAYDKAKIKDAPNVGDDGHLSPEEEERLYAYYGRSEDYSRGYEDRSFDDRAPVGNDVSGPETDNAMTRSEEELRVSKQQREAGRARLRKYVVTEQEQVTVPVQREEVRIEREPITDANVGNAMEGPAISEEEHEVVLHEEQITVDKQAVPKERVRLDKETVVEEQTVSDEVRKEQIEVEGIDDTRR